MWDVVDDGDGAAAAAADVGEVDDGEDEWVEDDDGDGAAAAAADVGES